MGAAHTRETFFPYHCERPCFTARVQILIGEEFRSKAGIGIVDEMGDARSELENDFLAPWPLQGEWIRLELFSCNPGCQLHVEDNAKSFNWTAVKSMLQDAHATICTEEGI